MSVSLKFLRECAEVEKSAEASRDRADMKWRKAWWITTMALAEVPATPKEGVTKALDTVAAITGQSRKHLTGRRRTGHFFSTLERTEVESLPPRLAMKVTEKTPTDSPEVVAAKLRQYEDDGTSLREAAEEMTGKPWTATPENLTASQKDSIVRERVKESPAVLEAILKDPETAHAATEVIVRQNRQAVTRREPSGSSSGGSHGGGGGSSSNGNSHVHVSTRYSRAELEAQRAGAALVEDANEALRSGHVTREEVRDTAKMLRLYAEALEDIAASGGLTDEALAEWIGAE